MKNNGWHGEWRLKDEILEVSVFHCDVKAKLIPPDPDDEEQEGIFVCPVCGATISADFLCNTGKASFIGCEIK